MSFLLLIQVSFFSHAQMVAIAEIKEKIEGICDDKKVYALLPMFGDQVEAICSVADSTIERRLNEEVVFLKENTKLSAKGMVNILVNCHGQVVLCKIDKKTKSADLDEQILTIFKSLTSWKAGKLDGNEVDSMRLWSFEIKKGKLTLN